MVGNGTARGETANPGLPGAADAAAGLAAWAASGEPWLASFWARRRPARLRAAVSGSTRARSRVWPTLATPWPTISAGVGAGAAAALAGALVAVFGAFCEAAAGLALFEGVLV